jgi:hypothetical protein
MKNKFILKIASISKENKNELAHTGVIFGAGVAGSLASNLAGKHLGWSNSVKRMTAIGSAAALATDYAAVKLNKHIGDHDQTKQASDMNPYLEKISYKHKG